MLNNSLSSSLWDSLIESTRKRVNWWIHFAPAYIVKLFFVESGIVTNSFLNRFDDSELNRIFWMRINWFVTDFLIVSDLNLWFFNKHQPSPSNSLEDQGNLNFYCKTLNFSIFEPSTNTLTSPWISILDKRQTSKKKTLQMMTQILIQNPITKSSLIKFEAWPKDRRKVKITTQKKWSKLITTRLIDVKLPSSMAKM